VHFLGEQMDMCSLYSISDCVVGIGRVTLEAMSCRCPVVAVGTSGFFGALEPARFNEGWIHYFGDHTAPYPLSSSRIRHSLQDILNSHGKSEWYGVSGRKYVKKYFRIDVVTTQVMDVYERTISDRM
jgi:L-malate glycosyltransferase